MLPGFLLRMLRRGGYRARMLDRFAIYPEGLFDSCHGGEFVWVHAVSVGEVQVAGQLMREWRDRDASVRFLFSTTSSTGWKMAEKEVTGRDVLIYNPLDFPTFVKAALARVNPRAIVLTESEIWPNFIRRAAKMKIPLFLVNARVSDRSAPRYKAGRFFFKDVFRCFTRIFAQSELDRSRLAAAGADPARIDVTGSFKFDVARRNEVKERELESWLVDSGFFPAGNRILLGGSTWPGEDEALLKILDKLTGVTLVIAPRHFEKADAVEENIVKSGRSCLRRSTGKLREAAGESKGVVFLADTTGELMGLYGIADAVFVGKSLCAHGSQNMIEPCLCGKPTVVGPYTENFRPVMSDLMENGGICQVSGEAELESTLVKWFSEGDGGLGERAARAVLARKGVVPRCVGVISSNTAPVGNSDGEERFSFMKTSLKTVLFASALFAVLVGALIFFGPCSVKPGAADASAAGTAGSAQPAERKIPKPDFVRTASVYAAALARPDASGVLVTGDDAKYGEIFASLFPGAVTTNSVPSSPGGRFDLVFVSSGGVRAAAEARSSLAEGGVLATLLDVRGMKAGRFKKILADYPCDDVRLWMFSQSEWMLVGRSAGSKVKMADMLAFFSRDGVISVEAEAAGCGSVQDVFAGYVGKREAIMPAFEAGGRMNEVKPEYFIAEKVPLFDWLDPDGVDADIAGAISAAIYDRQDVRRIIVRAEVASRDKKNLDAALEAWADAMKRNPGDTMLLDRLYRLAVNAKAFRDLGKFAEAAYCYETMIAIRPDDRRVGEEYITLLRQLGRNDLAASVAEKLNELNDKPKGGKGSRYDVQ